MKTISIDLGTYNTLCLYADDSGEIRTVKHRPIPEEQKSGFKNYSEEDEKEMPSFIYIENDGKISAVGYKAKEKSMESPMNVIWGVKRILGKTYMSMLEELDRYPFRIEPDPMTGNCIININENLFTPTELLSVLFRQIYSDLHSNKITEWDKIIITIPVYYSNSAVTEIINAAADAGFLKEKISTMSEPVAAALAQKFSIREGVQVKTLVCDIGAGTTDLTAGWLSMVEGEVSYTSIKNLGARFGGLDLTNLLVKIIQKKLGLCEIRQDLQSEIQQVAEWVKIKLTSAIEVEFGIQKNFLFITRDELQQVMNPFLEQITDLIHWSCDGAGWSINDVQHLLIIGGPSICPIFKSLFSSVFNENQFVLEQINAFYNCHAVPGNFRMNAVAFGALNTIKCIDLQSFGFGVELTRFPSEHIMERYPKVLIPPDSFYPYESEPLIIPILSQAGTDIKILQFKANKDNKPDVSFIGVIKFLTKNLFFISEIKVQMIMNQRRQLIIRLSDIYGGKRVYEFESMQGSNLQINIDYPIIHSLPEFHRSAESEYIFGPDNNDLIRLKKFLSEMHNKINERSRELPVRITGVLDELVNEQDFYELFNTANNIIWNLKATSLFSAEEIYEIECQLFEFEKCLVKEKKVKN